MPSLPSELFAKSFPWSTLGRLEPAAEFFKKCREQSDRVALFPITPKFSVVVTVDRQTDAVRFREAVLGLRAQSYAVSEVLFVWTEKDSTPLAPLLAVVAEAAMPHFRWVSTPNRDLGSEPRVFLKNLAAREAIGDWIGFQNGEDVLSPVALFFFALELVKTPKADLLFSNEATLERSSKKILGFLSKPELSHFNLLHFNPIGRFWLVRKSCFDELKGFSEEASEVHEHDFFLRLYESTDRFRLVPFFLYYRRETDRGEPDRKGRLTDRLQEHLERKKIPASVSVERNGVEFLTRVCPKVEEPKKHLVSVIICFRDKVDWTLRCLEDLSTSLGDVPIEIFLVNNRSTAETLDRLREFLKDYPWSARIIDYDGPFNFAEMHNRVVRDYCQGKYLLLLNNDVFWKKGNLDRLVGWAQMDWVGTVGCLLRYQHGGVQHGGFRAWFGGQARLARIGHSQRADRFALRNREVFGNTFALCLVKRETFLKVGGLRVVDLPNGFGDVAFNFECLRQGLKNLYLGEVEGIHLESASRGMSYEYWEEFAIEREYPEILQRMLREDLGVDRVPGVDYSVTDAVHQLVMAQLRAKASRLKPWKPKLQNLIRGLRFKRDTLGWGDT